MWWGFEPSRYQRKDGRRSEGIPLWIVLAALAVALLAGLAGWV